MICAQRTRLGGLLLQYEGEMRIDYYLSDLHAWVEPKYFIDRCMMTGAFDEPVQAFIAENVAVGSVCVDVGANIGAMTLGLCKAVGSSGRVFAFEPGLPFLTRLKKNINANPQFLSRVEIIPSAVSDKEGYLFWNEDAVECRNASCISKTGIKIECTTLDSFATKYNLQRLDFVKLDIEGMELEAMQGGLQTLTKFKPILLYETLIEVEKNRGRKVLFEIENLLNSLGYQIYGLTKRGAKIPTSYPHYESNSVAIHNLKALRA